MILAVAVGAALAEELGWRGYALDRLLTRRTALMASIPLAVAFAWIYVNTGRSILSTIALHALDNVASVIVGPEDTEVMVRLAAVTALAVGVTLLWGPKTLGGRRGSPS